MSDNGAAPSALGTAARRLLGVAAVVALGAAWLRVVPPATSQGGDDDGAYRREFLSYVGGLILALALTGAAFGMVNWSVTTHLKIEAAIGALALLQIIVHFRFFLHIDLSKQKREDLELILFSTLILVVMVGGTIWILTNLATRM